MGVESGFANQPAVGVLREPNFKQQRLGSEHHRGAWLIDGWGGLAIFGYAGRTL
jgi:hypothetical protein